MPAHIKFVIFHAFVGFGISLTFTGLILWFNIGNLWHLVTHTAEGPIAVVMLVIFGTVTFGSAQIGYKIMTMTDDDTPSGGKPAPQVTNRLIPVKAEARSVDNC